jgi:3-hydroxybutyryl-CoA dehydrogenase
VKSPAKTAKRKRTPTQPKASKRAEAGRTPVYIIGDWNIVSEFATLCASNGFFVYFDYNVVPDIAPAFDSNIARKSAQIPQGISFALELTNIDLERKRKNLERLDRALLPTTAIASSSVTVSATEQSSWIAHKGRLVGCSALPSIGQRPLIEIAPTAFTPTETVSIVLQFFRSIGKEIELVQDRIGMVFPRLVCQLINEAAFALQEEIATPQDIDMTMKVGANHPLGPIMWADRIGLDQVRAVLDALHGDLGDVRYCMAPLLKQMALSGTWWHRM